MFRRNLPVIGAMLASLAAIGVAALIAWNQLNQASAGISGARTNGEAVIAPGISLGGPFALQNHAGQTVTEADFAGQFMLLHFGFTNCPDVCPTELGNMAAAIDILGDRNPAFAEAVVPIFITIDPARDTQDIVGDYASAFHPRMIGLTGPPEAIDAVAKHYRVYYSQGKPSEDGFYLMNHTSFVYLVGPENEFVSMFHSGTAADDIADALERYVRKTEATS